MILSNSFQLSYRHLWMPSLSMNHPSSVLNWMENENQRYTLEDCFWNIWWKNPASGCYIAETFIKVNCLEIKICSTPQIPKKNSMKKNVIALKEGSKNSFCSQNPHAPPLISMSMNRTINDKSCGFSHFIWWEWYMLDIKSK